MLITTRMLSHIRWLTLKTAVVWGKFKRVREDGKVLLKVINFLVPENCGFAGESMWVEVIKGNDNEGIGRLNNIPYVCEDVKVNDIVIYEGGTDERNTLLGNLLNQATTTMKKNVNVVTDLKNVVIN